jgi:small subunit ribosomal protein S13
MPRVIGVDIPPNKRLEIALTYIYGVGLATSHQVCDALKLDRGVKARDLTEEQIANLANYLQKEYPVEGTLRRQVAAAIARCATSVAIAACATAAVCPCADSARARTRARARVRARRSPGRSP